MAPFTARIFRRAWHRRAIGLPAGGDFATIFMCTRSSGSRCGPLVRGWQAISRVTPASLPTGAKWVYDHPFFVLLNLAVGGQWPGNPDDTSTFPQTMLVDYVRVYQR